MHVYIAVRVSEHGVRERCREMHRAEAARMTYSERKSTSKRERENGQERAKGPW